MQESNQLNTESSKVAESNSVKESENKNYKAKLEAILFMSTKPVHKKKLIKLAEIQSEELFKNAIDGIKQKYNVQDSGINLMELHDEFQFGTAPSQAELIQSVYQSDMTGELTKPALETLSVISYRGPLTKPELELIRGVNCSLILRNLLMRGLITEKQDKSELLPVYTISMEFLQYLGYSQITDLPKYEELNSNELLTELLKQRGAQEQQS